MRADCLKEEYEDPVGHNQEIDDTFISLYADKEKEILISEEERSEEDVQMLMGEIKRYAVNTELDETVRN